MVDELVLYAQPQGMGPGLKREKLEKGIIEKKRLWTFKLTDIGIDIVKTFKEVDSIESFSMDDPTARLPPYNLVAIGESLELNLKVDKYKGTLSTNEENLYAYIKIKGNQDKISEFMNALTQRIDYSPWDVDDWEEFESKTGLSREEVIESWRQYIPDLVEEIEEKKKKEKTCVVCGKELGFAPSEVNGQPVHRECKYLFYIGDWEHCPLCGSEADFEPRGINKNYLKCRNCSAEWEVEAPLMGEPEKIRLHKTDVKEELKDVSKPFNWWIKTDLAEEIETVKKMAIKKEKEKERKKEEELTPLMKEYEEETGKHAIWRGEVTKQFDKWKEKKTKNICPECGADLEPDAEFCIKCGAKL